MAVNVTIFQRGDLIERLGILLKECLIARFIHDLIELFLIDRRVFLFRGRFCLTPGFLNIVSLLDSDAYAGDFGGTDTFGSTNSTIAFYRLPASMRKGCYPIEYVEYVVSNRSDSVPVLLRTSFRFIDSGESASHERQNWESEAEAPYPDDDPDFPETGLSTLVTSVEVLEGVAAVYFLPWSVTQEDFGELDEDVQPDVVDVYLELLPPGLCKRAAKIADPAKQSAFVSRNSLRLARRFAIKSHPAFDIPPDLKPWWRMDDCESGAGGASEGGEG